MTYRFTRKAYSVLPALLVLFASLLWSQSRETTSTQPSAQTAPTSSATVTPAAAEPAAPTPAQTQSGKPAQPQADKKAPPHDKNTASDENAAPEQNTSKPQASTTPVAAPAASTGCLAVKPIGSHGFRNIMLFGVAGALISKEQYKVMDVVNYPVSVGTKFHGTDLQTISSSGTKVVVLDKHYKQEDLQKACH